MDLFGLTLFTQGPSWRAWRVDDEPLAAYEPGCRHGPFAGGLSGLNLSDAGEPAVTAPMCLIRDMNFISDQINGTGRWHDCRTLVMAWRERRPPPNSPMIEVGGNIGACSLELLLRTDARLIIFEPSPKNLYYLTRTLQAVHQHQPTLGVASRVVIFPIGLGNKTSTSEMYVDIHNSGDSMVVGKGEARASSTASSRHKFRLQGTVRIVPLMKMDVQGYECRALQGMQRLLSSRSVSAIVTEVSLPHLKRAQCSKAGLLGSLHDSGYRVDHPDGGRGAWSWDVLAVLQTGR